MGCSASSCYLKSRTSTAICQTTKRSPNCVVSLLHLLLGLMLFLRFWFTVSVARRCVAVISGCLTAPPLEITALAVDWAE